MENNDHVPEVEHKITLKDTEKMIGTLKTKADDKPKVPGKKRGPKPKTKALIRYCKTCGVAGHRADGCPKRFYEKTPLSTLEVTQEIKEEIAEMLMEGKGSREIAVYYGVSIEEANKAIATSKGFKLPQ